MFHHLANAKHDGLLEIWMCKSPGLRRGRSLGYFTFVMDNNFFVVSSRHVGARRLRCPRSLRSMLMRRLLRKFPTGCFWSAQSEWNGCPHARPASIGFYVQPPVQFVQALAHPG